MGFINDISLIAIIMIILSLIGFSVLLKAVTDRIKKEKYCVDISGGFKAPCDCTGNCKIKVK